jgi:catechol 2,3-dioxygenase-like lactoylglutathione lyase family enzyme
MIRTRLVSMGIAAAGLLLGAASRPPAPPTRFKAINHVGIATSDIDRSIHFYRDLFGMELQGQVLQIDDNQLYNHIFGLRQVRAKGATLRLGGMDIELWEFQRPRGKPSDPIQPVNDPRINHICFEVADVQKEYERLKAAGVPFNYPPQDFGGPKAVYGRDPDGNVFELIQLSTK